MPTVLACMCGGIVEVSLVGSILAAVPIVTNIWNRLALNRHKRKIVRELRSLSRNRRPVIYCR